MRPSLRMERAGGTNNSVRVNSDLIKHYPLKTMKLAKSRAAGLKEVAGEHVYLSSQINSKYKGRPPRNGALCKISSLIMDASRSLMIHEHSPRICGRNTEPENFICQ